MLPVASEAGTVTSPLTALFVSTSAVSTTGLSPVDTADHWSAFGEGVVLALIQFGGLGFMALATLALLLLRRRLSLATRAATAETLGRLGIEQPGATGRIVRRVIGGSLLVELVGTLALLLVFIANGTWDGGSAVWRATFTALSAFNTAGFDIEGAGAGLTGESTNAGLIAVVLALSILGGTGYAIWADVLARRSRHRLAIDTKLVFLGIALSWIGGSAMVLFLEAGSGEALGSGFERVTNATFTAISGGTTVGFSTINVGALRETTAILLIALMFVGAAPASTAGGIKITTWAVLLFTMIASLRGADHVNAFRREIAWTYVNRALTAALLGVAISFGVGLLLTAFTATNSLNLIFEGVSAFGTVGLSRGVTAELTLPSQAVVIVAMFLGRVGPLSLALVFVRQGQPARYRYAQEAVSIG